MGEWLRVCFLGVPRALPPPVPVSLKLLFVLICVYAGSRFWPAVLLAVEFCGLHAGAAVFSERVAVARFPGVGFLTGRAGLGLRRGLCFLLPALSPPFVLFPAYLLHSRGSYLHLGDRWLPRQRRASFIIVS